MGRAPRAAAAAAVVILALTGSIVTSLPAGAASMPRVHFGPIVEVVEGAPDTSTEVSIELSLDAPSTTATTWRWVTFPEVDFVDEFRPSTAGVDYLPEDHVVTFAAGQTTTHVTVTVLGDDWDEAPEFIALVAARDEIPIDYATIAFGMIHILDDDPPPVIVPGVAWVTEGPGAVLHVPVTLTNPSELGVTAAWTTLNVPGAPPAEALSPADYDARSGFVFFPTTGATSAVVDIPVVDDGSDEPDEYVVISIHDPQNAGMGGFWGLGFGVIRDG